MDNCNASVTPKCYTMEEGNASVTPPSQATSSNLKPNNGNSFPKDIDELRV